MLFRSPLTEAKKIVKQLKVQFAGKLDSDQRTRLTEIQAQLNQQLAERDFRMAKFYDRAEERRVGKECRTRWSQYQ